MGCLSFWHEPVCKSVSFLNHFTAWILMLIIFWIASVLSIHYWCSGCKGVFNFKTDIIVLIGIITFSLLIAIIPIVTDGYGMNQAWCWIKTNRIVEQWLLWYGWVTVCTIAVLLMLSIALCYTNKKMKLYYESSRGTDNFKQLRCKAEARKIKTLILCIIVYLSLVTTSSILNHVTKVSDTVTFLVIIGITEPLFILILLVMFIKNLYKAKNPSTDTTGNLETLAPPSAITESDASTSINMQSHGGLNSRKVNSSGGKYHGMEYSEEITTSLLLTQTVRSDISD